MPENNNSGTAVVVAVLTFVVGPVMVALVNKGCNAPAPPASHSPATSSSLATAPGGVNINISNSHVGNIDTQNAGTVTAQQSEVSSESSSTSTDATAAKNAPPERDDAPEEQRPDNPNDGRVSAQGTHLLSHPNGDVSPAPGYDWAAAGGENVNVKWVPGTGHLFRSHIIAAVEEGWWKPEVGWIWSSDDQTSLRVRWSPGRTDPATPHVLASTKPDNWEEAPGYEFLGDGESDLRTRWKADLEIAGHPHVVSGTEEGTWCPAKGYQWDDPDDSASYRVVKRSTQ